MEMKKVTRKMLADRIASVYRNFLRIGNYVGLCTCYGEACYRLFNVILIPHDLHLLPAFVPPENSDWGDYWWPLKDIDARLFFCDKLHNLYKDDETDLTPIVHGYLDFDIYEDREAYAKKYLECYEKNISFNPLEYENK